MSTKESQTPAVSKTPVERSNQAVANVINLPPDKMVKSKEVEDRFVNLYQLIHGKKNGKQIYQREAFHFLKVLSDDAEDAAKKGRRALKDCNGISLYGAFLDSAVDQLSFEPALKHLYLVTYGDKCVRMIGGQGELFMRQLNGQIKHADNPVLVYEGDKFNYGSRNEQIYVEHEAFFPRKEGAAIIGCYLRIVRNDGTIDYKVFSMDEIQKLREFSKQPNSLAWTKGLPGMVQTKTIKHAFKSYPRVRKGQFTQLETETIDIDAIDIYGLGEQPAAALPAAEKEAFPGAATEQAPPPTQTVTYDDAEDGGSY